MLEKQRVAGTFEGGEDGGGETQAKEGDPNAAMPDPPLFLNVPSCSLDQCWDAMDGVAGAEGGSVDTRNTKEDADRASWEEEHGFEFLNPEGGLGIGKEEPAQDELICSDGERQQQVPHFASDGRRQEAEAPVMTKVNETESTGGHALGAPGTSAQAEVQDLSPTVNKASPRAEASHEEAGDSAKVSGCAAGASDARVSQIVHEVLMEEITGKSSPSAFGAKLRESMEQSHRDHVALEKLTRLVEDQRLVISGLLRNQTAQEETIALLREELTKAHEGFDAHDQEIQQLRGSFAPTEVVNALGRELSVHTDSTALILKGIDSRLELMQELRAKDNAVASSVSVSALAKAKVEGFQNACLSLAIRGYFPRQLLQQVSFTDLLKDKEEISWAVIDADSRRARNHYEHSRAASSLDAHYATPGPHAAVPNPVGHASTSEVPPATTAGRGGGSSGGRGGDTEASPNVGRGGGTGAGWSSAPRK